MDNTGLSQPSESQPPSIHPADSVPHKIFFNDGGLRSGWRLLIYAVIVALIVTAVGIIIGQFARPPKDVFSPFWTPFFESVQFIAVFGGAGIMSRIERRSPGVYGLPLAGAFGKRFWQGWFVGLCEITALIGLIAVFGGYSFGSLALHGGELVRWAAFWALFFVLVGLFEEFLFRGYVQFTLADGTGFWPAAILLSTAFGGVHLYYNPGENPVGAISVVAIGLVFAFGLKRTGNLWFVVGIHASFDFGETFLFSAPNSGLVFAGHLSNASFNGKPWLTGGTVGPEGSVFSFLTMAILAVVIHFLFPAKKNLTLPA